MTEKRRYHFDLFDERRIEAFENWFKEKGLSQTVRDFIQNQLVQPTKEEWKQSIQQKQDVEEREPQYKRLLEIAGSCVYHAADKNGDWYCERKKIPMEVCVAQLRRFMAMGNRCHPPKKQKFKAYKQKEDDPFKGQPRVDWNHGASGMSWDR